MRVLIHQTAELEESDIWTTCTAMVGVGQFCEQSVPKGAPVSLCKPHLVSAFLYCENLIVEQATQRDYGRSSDSSAASASTSDAEWCSRQQNYARSPTSPGH